MKKLLDFLKTLNVLVFKTRHSFITYYSEHAITTLKDEYTGEYIPSNESISSFMRAFVKRNCVSCSSRNDLRIEIVGTFHDKFMGYYHIAKFNRIEDRKSIYHCEVNGITVEIYICDLFTNIYFITGAPKYIHFSIFIK